MPGIAPVSSEQRPEAPDAQHLCPVLPLKVFRALRNPASAADDQVRPGFGDRRGQFPLAAVGLAVRLSPFQQHDHGLRALSAGGFDLPGFSIFFLVLAGTVPVYCSSAVFTPFTVRISGLSC